MELEGLFVQRIFHMEHVLQNCLFTVDVDLHLYWYERINPFDMKQIFNL